MYRAGSAAYAVLDNYLSQRLWLTRKSEPRTTLGLRNPEPKMGYCLLNHPESGGTPSAGGRLPGADASIRWQCCLRPGQENCESVSVVMVVFISLLLLLFIHIERSRGSRNRTDSSILGLLGSSAGARYDRSLVSALLAAADQQVESRKLHFILHSPFPQ